MKKESFLGDVSTEEFLKKYWNKKPLLIRNAVPNAFELASFEDFFQMASDADFETRMVYEKGGEYEWEAKVGPFKKSDFKKKSLWTLICHNLELFNSDFFELKKKVRFIPEWNFDDLMSTISIKGSSVGAHIDDYSVFIFQGRGSRKWLLEEKPVPDYFPDIDIKLLKKFKPHIEWVLQPGDMIYIPPGVAHHGISLEDSISYSLGFKSIRYKELLDFYISQIMSNIDEASFHDKKITLQEDPFLIQENIIEAIHKDLLKFMGDKKAFRESLMMYLSRPKNPVEATSIKKPAQFFKRDIWSKMTAIPTTNGGYEVAINEHLFLVKKETYQKLKFYFLQEPSSELHLGKADLKNKELCELVSVLLKEGAFY